MLNKFLDNKPPNFELSLELSLDLLLLLWRIKDFKLLFFDCSNGFNKLFSKSKAKFSKYRNKFAITSLVELKALLNNVEISLGEVLIIISLIKPAIISDKIWFNISSCWIPKLFSKSTKTFKTISWITALKSSFISLLLSLLLIKDWNLF